MGQNRYVVLSGPVRDFVLYGRGWLKHLRISAAGCVSCGFVLRRCVKTISAHLRISATLGFQDHAEMRRCAEMRLGLSPQPFSLLEVLIF